ncbi:MULTISPECIES: GGDEF domain-containing protein [Lactobacillaceae]|nr:GGDEF domain-containing protein [Lactobacillus sp. HBUAS51381]NLR10466.1 GGDEF domain-containing protein [Lactobacillus sp. HBUAS51381]
MTWSEWQVPPFISSVFFILGVLTLYWVTFTWLETWCHRRHVAIADDVLNAWYGVIYMLVFVFSMQTPILGRAIAWEFMNFQLIAVIFCAYFLNIHISGYFFPPIVLAYMVFNGSLRYWQSWGYAITLVAFFLVMNWIRVKFHDQRHAWLVYMGVGVAFGGVMWLWMKLKFHFSWATFQQEWLYLVIFELLLYAYVNMLTHDGELKVRLSRLASHDTLTQTQNFSAYTSAMKFLFRESSRTDQPLSMIMFDIDHFKQVNDTYGHSAGDAVLQQVAATVKSVLTNTDSKLKLYRTGGEEFNILLPNYDLSRTSQIATAIFEAVNRLTVTVGTQEIRVSLSIGVSTMLTADASPMDFYNRVDQNLYYAKQHGRKQITVA